jgi:ectoine hydroxylase
MIMKQMTPITLSAAQGEAYERDGFVVLEDLLSAEEVAAFLAHQPTRSAELAGSIRSHVADRHWGALAAHRNVAGVAEQLLNGAARVVQTMYLPKPAGEDRVGISFHQDTHHLLSEPNTLMACWVAMSDTGAENGGFCVVPGSHLTGLRETHKSVGDEHSSWSHEQLMRDPAGKEWKQEFYSFEIDGIDQEKVRRLEVPAGAGVFFSGMTIHGSYANRSATADRLAWAVHYVKEGSWVYRCDVQETVGVAELGG